MDRSDHGRRSPWLPLGMEIGVQALLVLALGIWLLQGRPLGYAPEWALQAHAPWPGMRLWRVLSGVVGAGLIGWWAIRKLGSSVKDPPSPLPSLGPRPLALTQVVTILLTLWILALYFQANLHGLADLAGPTLIASTWSDVGTEYFRTAYEIQDLRSFLGDYPLLMHRAQYHVATHPPGAVLFYWLGIRILEQIPPLQDLFLCLAEYWSGGSATEIAQFVQQFPSPSPFPRAAIPATLFCNFLLMLLGSSVVIPLYLLARLVGDRRTALLTAACFCTVPSFLLFFQSLDQLILVGATWAVYFFLRGMQQKQPRFFLAAGLAWGWTLFISLGALALGAILGVFWTAWAWQQSRDIRWSQWAAGGVWFLGGAIGWWILMALAGSFSPLEVVRQGLAAHARVTTVEFPRTYGIWVWLNWIDWAIFLGLPLSLWWVRSLGTAVTRLRNLRKTRPSPGLPLPVWLNLALLATLLALDLSGKVRAEVGRIWLFMMPLAVVGLVHWLREQDPQLPLRLGVVWGLQLVQTGLMALTLTPLVMPF